MSHNSSDERLVQLLQKYRSSPPPPKKDLEARLMAQIEAEPRTAKVMPFPKVQYPVWAVGRAIAASVLLLFTSVRFLQPTPYSTQQSAELEAFLIENWDAVTAPSPTHPNWNYLNLEQPAASDRR
ncbi:MAG: hypothetical protein GVY17_09620 [Cyanobacteria bacterium]|jgi:hypothetical protein|nr:hypothetical protein [Cyanobacteria bacterium GSL.Bin21]